jgi:hypothetical protein
VIQSGPGLSETIQPTVYLIGTIYLIALSAAAILSRKSERHALASEVAATLACVSAVIERRRRELAAAVLLLFVDLFIGFRVFFTFAAICVTLVVLTRDGELYLYKKLPTYGSAAAVMLVAMLSANAVRPMIFDQVAKFQSQPAAPLAQGGGIPAGASQNEQPANLGQAPAELPAKPRSNPLASSDWMSIPFKLVQQSGEPFVVQATLVAVIQTGLSCSPSNIFKSLFLLVPPGMARFAPANSYHRLFSTNISRYCTLTSRTAPPAASGQKCFVVSVMLEWQSSACCSFWRWSGSTGYS